eukprot:scaffold314335_cov35-Tisochrysis_lutea.AAC.4
MQMAGKTCFSREREKRTHCKVLEHPAPREIVNGQNAQISFMRAWIERFEASSGTVTEMCYEKCSTYDSQSSRRLLFGSHPSDEESC